jgi:hypothetical protein
MTLHIFFQELIEMAKKDLERNKAEQKRKSSRAKTNVDEDKVNNFYQLKNLAVLLKNKKILKVKKTTYYSFELDQVIY